MRKIKLLGFIVCLVIYSCNNEALDGKTKNIDEGNVLFQTDSTELFIASIRFIRNNKMLIGVEEIFSNDTIRFKADITEPKKIKLDKNILVLIDETNLDTSFSRYISIDTKYIDTNKVSVFCSIKCNGSKESCMLFEGTGTHLLAIFHNEKWTFKRIGGM